MVVGCNKSMNASNTRLLLMNTRLFKRMQIHSEEDAMTIWALRR